ncbi:spermidine hydroxycinnamoyl transferase-like [Vitis riparia]|uniref:spermidine hydroxycinnamoyl transferase-like n=1 Tax=Vitis riparia TaxID=96939 RepID=UPI00155AB1D3|nr:spermidine hydroxycinnamoyl transferase-like [Vitis riparia]
MATYTVRPTKETPGGYGCLSDSDQVRAITHAPTIYFYPPVNVSLESATEILRHSLSESLVIFYPLAGRLHWIGGGHLVLECNALGALLIAVESEAKIDDFGDFRPTQEIRALIPSVDYKKPIYELPLLLVQVTKFSCGGMSLGLGIAHTIADGLGALHFISEWTKIARGEQPNSPPFLDRSVLLALEHLSAPVFDHPEYSTQALLIGKQDNMEERKRETATLMYEAVAGHIWRSACKVRQHESQQPTTLSIIVDARNRMEPSLPPRYFGNATFREDVTQFRNFHTVGCAKGAFYGNPNLEITSWARLSICGADFSEWWVRQDRGGRNGDGSGNGSGSLIQWSNRDHDWRHPGCCYPCGGISSREVWAGALRSLGNLSGLRSHNAPYGWKPLIAAPPKSILPRLLHLVPRHESHDSHGASQNPTPLPLRQVLYYETPRPHPLKDGGVAVRRPGALPASLGRRPNRKSFLQ